MTAIIDKLIIENPDIKYTKIDSQSDEGIYKYYTSKYNLPVFFPIFIGLVDNTMQDGHIGTATQLMLESLVN